MNLDEAMQALLKADEIKDGFLRVTEWQRILNAVVAQAMEEYEHDQQDGTPAPS